MKRILFCLMVIIVMLGIGTAVNAYTLEVRGQGTSIHGTYNLIYDPHYDITWYDFTSTGRGVDAQLTWVDALSVGFGGNIYEDWRLPETVDGPYVSGYDGNTTGGYNITTSEMGHLFYTDLGNKGYSATDGTTPQPGYGLSNTGDFQNLIPYIYWSGMENATNTLNTWRFGFDFGFQGTSRSYNRYLAIAVRDGDVVAAQAIPEPTTVIFLGIGLAGLAGVEVRRRRKKRAVDKS